MTGVGATLEATKSVETEQKCHLSHDHLSVCVQIYLAAAMAHLHACRKCTACLGASATRTQPSAKGSSGLPLSSLELSSAELVAEDISSYVTTSLVSAEAEVACIGPQLSQRAILVRSDDVDDLKSGRVSIQETRAHAGFVQTYEKTLVVDFVQFQSLPNDPSSMDLRCTVAINTTGGVRLYAKETALIGAGVASVPRAKANASVLVADFAVLGPEHGTVLEAFALARPAPVQQSASGGASGTATAGMFGLSTAQAEEGVADGRPVYLVYLLSPSSPGAESGLRVACCAVSLHVVGGVLEVRVGEVRILLDTLQPLQQAGHAGAVAPVLHPHKDGSLTICSASAVSWWSAASVEGAHASPSKRAEGSTKKEASSAGQQTEQQRATSRQAFMTMHWTDVLSTRVEDASASIASVGGTQEGLVIGYSNGYIDLLLPGLRHASQKPVGMKQLDALLQAGSDMMYVLQQRTYGPLLLSLLTIVPPGQQYGVCALLLHDMVTGFLLQAQDLPVPDDMVQSSQPPVGHSMCPYELSIAGYASIRHGGYALVRHVTREGATPSDVVLVSRPGRHGLQHLRMPVLPQYAQALAAAVHSTLPTVTSDYEGSLRLALARAVVVQLCVRSPTATAHAQQPVLQADNDPRCEALCAAIPALADVPSSAVSSAVRYGWGLSVSDSFIEGGVAELLATNGFAAYDEEVQGSVDEDEATRIHGFRLLSCLRQSEELWTSVSTAVPGLAASLPSSQGAALVAPFQRAHGPAESITALDDPVAFALLRLLRLLKVPKESVEAVLGMKLSVSTLGAESLSLLPSKETPLDPTRVGPSAQAVQPSSSPTLQEQLSSLYDPVRVLGERALHGSASGYNIHSVAVAHGVAHALAAGASSSSGTLHSSSSAQSMMESNESNAHAGGGAGSGRPPISGAGGRRGSLSQNARAGLDSALEQAMAKASVGVSSAASAAESAKKSKKDEDLDAALAKALGKAAATQSAADKASSAAGTGVPTSLADAGGAPSRASNAAAVPKNRVSTRQAEKDAWGPLPPFPLLQGAFPQLDAEWHGTAVQPILAFLKHRMYVHTLLRQLETRTQVVARLLSVQASQGGNHSPGGAHTDDATRIATIRLLTAFSRGEESAGAKQQANVSSESLTADIGFAARELLFRSVPLQPLVSTGAGHASTAQGGAHTVEQLSTARTALRMLLSRLSAVHHPGLEGGVKHSTNVLEDIKGMLRTPDVIAAIMAALDEESRAQLKAPQSRDADSEPVDVVATLLDEPAPLVNTLVRYVYALDSSGDCILRLTQSLVDQVDKIDGVPAASVAVSATGGENAFQATRAAQVIRRMREAVPVLLVDQQALCSPPSSAGGRAWRADKYLTSFLSGAGSAAVCVEDSGTGSAVKPIHTGRARARSSFLAANGASSPAAGVTSAPAHHMNIRGSFAEVTGEYIDPISAAMEGLDRIMEDGAVSSHTAQVGTAQVGKKVSLPGSVWAAGSSSTVSGEHHHVASGSGVTTPPRKVSSNSDGAHSEHRMERSRSRSMTKSFSAHSMAGGGDSYTLHSLMQMRVPPHVRTHTSLMLALGHTVDTAVFLARYGLWPLSYLLLHKMEVACMPSAQLSAASLKQVSGKGKAAGSLVSASGVPAFPWVHVGLHGNCHAVETLLAELYQNHTSSSHGSNGVPLWLEPTCDPALLAIVRKVQSLHWSGWYAKHAPPVATQVNQVHSPQPVRGRRKSITSTSANALPPATPVAQAVPSVPTSSVATPRPRSAEDGKGCPPWDAKVSTWAQYGLEVWGELLPMAEQLESEWPELRAASAVSIAAACASVPVPAGAAKAASASGDEQQDLARFAHLVCHPQRTLLWLQLFQAAVSMCDVANMLLLWQRCPPGVSATGVLAALQAHGSSPSQSGDVPTWAVLLPLCYLAKEQSCRVAAVSGPGYKP